MPPKGGKGKGKQAEAKAEPEVNDSNQISFSSPGIELKPHYSAPSYLNSLAENDLPPFRQPTKEPRPTLSVPFSLVTEEDLVQMVLAAETDIDYFDGMRKFLCQYLVKKEIVRNYDLSERDFLASFIMETVDYAAQRDFSCLKLSVLLTIYLRSHLYFKWYYWSCPAAIWNYFKEMMIRHTIQRSPDGQEVFTPLECYDIVTHFHTMYISNLPLIHILTFGVHRLRLNWPFKPGKG